MKNFYCFSVVEKSNRKKRGKPSCTKTFRQENQRPNVGYKECETRQNHLTPDGVLW